MNMKNVWEQVKENNARLNKCDGHDFAIDMHPEKPWDKRYECIHCGGYVPSQAKMWYERGIAHEKTKQTQAYKEVD